MSPPPKAVNRHHPSTVTQAASRRIPELDGLRGIAILLVLMFHLTPARIPLLAAYFVQAGWLGVDLFFVLSGYLITGILVDSAGRSGYYRDFILRRTLRIFPLYFACLAIACIRTYCPAYSRGHGFFETGGWWYAAYLGNIQVFLQNRWPFDVALLPLWSLQVEEQFYLTFPLLVAVVTRRNLARILLAAVIAAPLFRIAIVWAMPANITGTYVLAPCRMDALALGGLVAIVEREFDSWLRSRWIAILTALSGAAVVAICWRYGPAPWSTAMRTLGFTASAWLFAGILILLIHQRRRGFLAVCRLRPLVWIGTISYGIYLVHLPMLDFVRAHSRTVFRVEPGSFPEALLILIATVGVAWVSWRFFESPILKLREHFSVAPKDPAAPA
jgi:peptidoglycan/LPS O-acetylase OafA/YrhL